MSLKVVLHVILKGNHGYEFQVCTVFHKAKLSIFVIAEVCTYLGGIYTAKNLLTAFIYISIEEPRSCLIIAFPDRNRVGNAASRSCRVISTPQYQSWQPSRSVPTKILLSRSPVYQNSILMETKCTLVCWGCFCWGDYRKG